MSDRFARTRLLFGDDGMRRLAESCVTVVGLGAVGSYAVEGLARAGVGRLRLVDFDAVRLSNLNRQLYALDSTLGRAKCDVARERVLDINPRCHAEAVNCFVDRRTVAGILAGAPDVLIDAVDSVGPKVELIAAAVRGGIRVVSSMGAAQRTDPQAVRVGELSETRICPLARFMRKRLGKRGITAGVRCVYSIEPVPAVAGPEPADDTAPGVEQESETRGRTRRPLPSFSCLTGMFGLIAAREAIFMILAGDRAATCQDSPLC